MTTKAKLVGIPEFHFMPSSQFVASRRLIAIDSAGREVAITLAIGLPYEVEPELWACPVQLEGLHQRLADQHGIDSWQALQLAYQLIVQLLSYFVLNGGTLLWPEGREELLLSELLPLLSSSGRAKNDA